MNARMQPEFYMVSTSDGGQCLAWFVEGFTSDYVYHWELSIAPIGLYGGDVILADAISTRTPGWYESFPSGWEGTAWAEREPTKSEILDLAVLIGNTQRRLKGLPVALGPHERY